jgi:aquaporin Z
MSGAVGDQEDNAAIAVGGAIALLVLFANPISGSSMNPVRTLAPDIVGVDFTGWWAYVFGDLIGVVIAVSLIALVRGMPEAAERTAAEGGLPLRRAD